MSNILQFKKLPPIEHDPLVAYAKQHTAAELNREQLQNELLDCVEYAYQLLQSDTGSIYGHDAKTALRIMAVILAKLK